MTKAGSWLANWKLHLQACVRHAVMRLNKMEGVRANLPEACFVIWADVSRLLYPDDQNPEITPSGDPAEVELEMELMQWLIREHKVCIIPGLDRFFGPGSTGHIWLSVATSIWPLTAWSSASNFGRRCLLQDHFIYLPPFYLPPLQLVMI